MEIILMVLFFGIAGSLNATHCDRELNYHENYGYYGFDITCEGLTNKNERMLREISIDQEFVLKISNSNLTKVTAELFSNVRKIKYLVITNSTFLLGENEEPFKNLTSLEHLIIENTVFNKLNVHTFQRLGNLKELKLLNCSVKYIKRDSFKLLNNLQILKLSGNSVRNLLDVPICELPKLKYLHLDYNQIEVLDKSNFFCFHEQNQLGLNLNHQNYAINFKQDHFLHQTNTTSNLIDLNLGHNRISKIEIFDWAFRLKYLNLENNNLKKISDKLFSLVDELEKLNLRNNFLEYSSPKAFAKLIRLKYISLENNALSNVYLENLLKLEEVNLSRNKIVSENLKNLNNLPKLRILYLNDNKINKLPLTFRKFSSLQLLDLSNNNFILTEDSFRGLSNLKQLSLRNNSLHEIPVTAFRNCSDLEILDISVNELETISDSHTFFGLDNLQVLNMSYNKFVNLERDLFESLHNLQVLDIAGNRLQNFQFSLISTLPSLSVINIKSNLLSCDILSKIIEFLRSKNINYSINEDFDYDKKNIGGIYCEETKEKLQDDSIDNNITVSSGIVIMFFIILSGIVFSIMFYKFLQYSKRRRYIMDEIELIGD